LLHGKVVDDPFESERGNEAHLSLSRPVFSLD
jgi:hypothetical protein